MKKQLIFAALIAACAFGANRMNAEIELAVPPEPPPGKEVTPPANVRCIPGEACPTTCVEPGACVITPGPETNVECIPGAQACPLSCEVFPGACVITPVD